MDSMKRENILDVYRQRRYPDANCSAETIKVLLITNIDSDNLGDHVIEICDQALLRAAARNLGITDGELMVASFPLALIPTAYCNHEDPALLDNAVREIRDCTFILFGGAPVFTFNNRIFYKKTATILSLAREMGKPVMFSAVGVDGYDEEDQRCLLLKEALHNGSVVHATTRDGIENLTRFADRRSVHEAGGQETAEPVFPVRLVSDPAVYADKVFKRHLDDVPAKGREGVPRIGIFVFRFGGFKSNGISFSQTEQCQLWRDLCQQLEALGWDYELLASGHFADEAALQRLIDKGFVRRNKCIVNINTAEQLVDHIRSYTAVVSCRLHPGIISFSCGVPSIGIVWNPKVIDFYRHINYPQRAVGTELLKKKDGRVSADNIVTALEKAIKEGVTHDPEYIRSVYTGMVDGIAKCTGRVIEEKDYFTDSRLERELGVFDRTPSEDRNLYISLKFTRCYRNYTNGQLKLEKLEKKQMGAVDLVYHSGAKAPYLSRTFLDECSGIVEELPSGKTQYRIPAGLVNNGQHELADCMFEADKMRFRGWRVRIRIGNQWCWCLKYGGIVPQVFEEGRDLTSRQAAVFQPGERLPGIPAQKIGTVVAEATWENTEQEIRGGMYSKLGRLLRRGKKLGRRIRRV